MPLAINRIIMISMQNLTVFLLFLSFIFPISILSVAVDNISTTQFLKDGDTLVSSAGSFAHDFFSTKGLKNKYVGIWYTSDVLRVIQPGILALSINEISTTRPSSKNPAAQFLDSGNPVVKESGDDHNFLWQSFDCPGDTILPGMKHGVDLVTGLDRCLRSWRSNDGPSLGNFTYGYEPQGYPQLILGNNSAEQFRLGRWNGLGFSGMPNLKKNSINRFEFVFNEKKVYFMYELENSSSISRYILNSEVAPRRLIWVDRTKTWAPHLISTQRDTCDTYKHCGANGICSTEISPHCQCLDKVVPKYPNQWENADWSSRCVRRTSLHCKTDGFIKYSAIKLPDTRKSWFNRAISLKECEAVCLMNCTCMAYTSHDIRNGGSGCLIWFGDLLDIRRTFQNGQDIYITMSASELEQSSSQKKKRFIIIVSWPVVLAAFLLVFSLCLCSQRKKSGPNREGRQEPKIQDYTNENQKEDLDLPLFGLTNNFSVGNKLGEGGFGAVYKNHAMRVSAETLVVLLFFSTIFSILEVSIARDVITTTRFLKDGDTLVSSGGIFELGFFSLSESSNKRYVGIWFMKTSDRTVVWVANREIPLTDSSGVLKVIQPGILTLFNGTNSVIWSSNNSRFSSNPVAKLLDSGNLIVGDANHDSKQDNFLWQSFDYPGDTNLPGMKIGKDFVTGLDRYLTSWKSSDDPTPGDATFPFDTHGYPQGIIRKGSVELFRTGPWNGLRFSGTPNMKENAMFTFEFVFNEKEIYTMYKSKNSSPPSRFLLDSGGAGRHWIWTERTQRWTAYLSAQVDNCDTYKLCGAHGSCNVNDVPPCRCLDKFEPKHLEEWKNSDWSDGCVRRKPLDCQTDGFIKYSNIKLPDTSTSWFNKSMSLEDCKVVCLKNCSCMAYANLDIRNGGRGCLLWFSDLLDMREFPQNGQDIYIRIASSDLEQLISGRRKLYVLRVSLPVLLGMVLLGLSLILYARRKKPWSKRKGRGGYTMNQDYTEGSQEKNLELPLIDFSTVAKAVNNFSIENKIGEGGFGPVYKGVLEGGQEIAVKRLSKSSRQGHDEFKNEVICIAKLQHRNLVKLLGYCVHEEEKLLIYEYMPNKSLDYFLFDEIRKRLLEWPQRFCIINGIARGLLYLHQDSRLRIIHRDLKAGNILLDVNMNAKISDFGLARSFAENESKANTLRIAGTYGYMSPEYAIDGLFSLKSDVFSFGVLVIEIVSGKRNRGFFRQEHQHNLVGHAWKLFNEDKSMELVDETLGDLYCPNEVLRSIHVGLLCVQQRLENRPTMSSVVMMLGGEGILPPPTQPGFFIERSIEYDHSSSTCPSSSINQVSVTEIDGR